MKKETKITYILFGLAVLSAILHNAFYGIFKIEEAVFFIFALVFLLGFIISTIYDVILVLRRKGPDDLWKLGFLGIFGLLGLIPGFSVGFYGFFGLFGFFGAKARKKKKYEI